MTNESGSDSGPGIKRPPRNGAGSAEKRIVANVALGFTAVGENLASIARKLDSAEGDRRRAALFAVADQLDGLIETVTEARAFVRDLANKDVTT